MNWSEKQSLKQLAETAGNITNLAVTVTTTQNVRCLDNDIYSNDNKDNNEMYDNYNE